MRILKKLLFSNFFVLCVFQTSCHEPQPKNKHGFIPLTCNGEIDPTPKIATIKEHEQIIYTVTNPKTGADAPVWTSSNDDCATIDPTTGITVTATGNDITNTVCVAHITVTQAGCIGYAILTVTPTTSQCPTSPTISPSSVEIQTNVVQTFTANNIGTDPAQTTWSASNTACATVNELTGNPTNVRGHNTGVSKCFTDITAVNGPCYAQALLTVDPVSPTCTSTTTNEPPALSAKLGVTLYNDTACTYPDENVYVYLIGTPDGSPNIAIASIVGYNNGYPLIEMNVPTSYPVQIPYFTLNQLNQGGFYIQTGSTFGGAALANARFFIALGSHLNSLVLNSAANYTQPTEITPWDIFEFGYDPNKAKAYGYNTSQVNAFSVPLWFKVSPLNNIPSNPPLPLGIQLRTSASPMNFGSQKQIIDYYKTQNSAAPELFTFAYLGQTDSNGNQRIQSPAASSVVVPPAQATYFDSSITAFQTFYASTYPTWQFLMCTSDPGPTSTSPYPGCAATGSTCPNSGLLDFPQCNAAGNTCAGVPPTGYRNVGTCYMGYTVANIFYYFTFQDDTPAGAGCQGTVGYNGNTTPIITPPAGGQGGLCALDLSTIPGGLTLTECILANNCYTTQGVENGTFNPQIMAAVMRNSVTNRETSGIAPQPPYTRWTVLPALSPVNSASPYYKTAPYNFYARIWHEIGFNYYAYGFGFDDAGGQSTTYTPNASTLTNVVIGIGW